MVCISRFTNLSSHVSDHSGILGGPMNLLAPHDLYSLNKLLLYIGLYMFTRVALFGLGVLVESVLSR